VDTETGGRSRFWDDVAESPLERPSFSRVAGRSLVLSVRHHLHAGDPCLDFGAGSGDLIEPILEIGCTIGRFRNPAMPHTRMGFSLGFD